jgi:hypothetical protein
MKERDRRWTSSLGHEPNPTEQVLFHQDIRRLGFEKELKSVSWDTSFGKYRSTIIYSY